MTSVKMSRSFVLLVLSLCPGLTVMFNFDLGSPIVIHDSYDRADSEFGASLSLLVSSSTGNGWIVIGSPKADSPQANYSKVKESGVVWKCEVWLVGEGERTCEIVQMDPIGELDVKIGQVPKDLIHRDRKDYGRFGSAMSAGSGNSSRFVICASRWANQKYKEHHLMNGLCYWINKEDLLSHDAYVADFSHRLVPLVNATRQAYSLATVGGQLTERRFDWAFGQAGFAVDISENNELLLGAPGILEWAGSVVQYRDYDPIKLSVPFRRFNQRDTTYAQVLIPKAQSSVNRKLINYFDYFGYSVISGRFFESTGRTQYAGGAPRGNSLNGLVLMFEFRDDIHRTFGMPPDDSIHFIADPIKGEGSGFFGSYFGSVLAAVDVNGDGYDDLVVGAPQYEGSTVVVEPSSGESTTESGDEGCIFVYISSSNNFSKTPQEICGDSRPGARFGSALAQLGDTNHDGFHDLAVGAPYESEGRGAVYIYLGSAPARLIFSQKLTPERLDVRIRTFGYSLRANVDVDNNGYGDLAIGAYESNHVVVFPTRPVVHIRGNISSSVVALGSTTGEFSVTSCTVYSGHRAPDELKIWVKLSLDLDLPRKSRIVEFVSGDNRIPPEQFSRGVITFLWNFTQTGSCLQFDARTVGDLDAVTVPVTVRQETWLEERNDEGASQIRLELKKGSDGRAVLEQESESEFSHGAHALPLAVPPAIESLASQNLGPVSLSIPILAICEEDGDPACTANLTLGTIFKTTEGEKIETGSSFVIGSSKSVVLQISLENHRERANLPLTLEISWVNPLTLRGSKGDCKKVNVLGETVLKNKKYACAVLTPLGKNKKEVIDLELDTTGLYAGKGHDMLTFDLRATTSSNLVQEATSKVELGLSSKSQVVLLGQSAEVSYYGNMTATTVNFTQFYEVSVQGISAIESVQLQVALPTGVLVKGRRLELLRIREPIITYNGLDMTCYAPNGTFYKDDLPGDVDLAQSTGRVKRQSSAKLKLVEPQPIIVNCQTPGVDCLWVDCEIHQFEPGSEAVVEFRLKMITETAREIFGEEGRDLLIIESMSRLSRVVGVQEERFALSRTFIRAQIEAELKPWILIVAIGTGISILTLIIIILMHFGFFKRLNLEDVRKIKGKRPSIFTFDNGTDPADSLEYYDGTMTNSDFDYTIATRGTKDMIYDEVK